MAHLNGVAVSFTRLSFVQVGERILDGSPFGDGKGIVLVLTPQEEATFVSIGGLAVGYSIADLIADAIEKRSGKRPKNLRYVYQDMKFTT